MANDNGPFQLPPLPWAENALEPVISARTLSFHHGKHHAAYVKKTNELVAGTRFADMPLERIIAETAGHPDHQKLFNQAAQACPHHGNYFERDFRVVSTEILKVVARDK